MEPTPGPAVPGNTGSYDFILDPEKQKKGLLSSIGKDPFITKIIFLIGGAMVVMLAAWLVITLVFGGGANIATFVALAQREQEIVRVSELGDDAVSQQLRNAAISTQVSIRSHQNKTLAHLEAHDRQVKPDELALKKDATTDAKLKQAKEASTFDTVYADILRSQLATYASELKAAYDNESSETQRQVLGLQYKDVQLLLELLPEDSVNG